VSNATALMDGQLPPFAYPAHVADAPIGIFDSGFGGLTVARAVLDQLPHESVVYFGDTARAPYGPRPIAETRRFALECLDRLVDHGVKLLVIACNTASAAVLHDARERYDLPVIEVIRPAVRRAAAATRTGRVGVISTLGTHQSQAYVDAFAAAPQIEVVSQPCPRFVEFVEAGVTGGKELLDVARGYLEPVVARDVDTLVLGCTHYPLLTGVISYVMGDGVTLVSSAEETAKDVYRVLADGDLLRPDDLPAPTLAFSTTGDADQFRRLARRFLGPEVETVFGNLAGTPVGSGVGGGGVL
jgi:glutamate racemase